MKLNKNTNLCNQTIHRVRKGFTLVEILVVMAIIAILGSISYGPILGFMDKGKITEVRKICAELRMSSEEFKSEYSYLPYVGTHPDIDTKFVTTEPAGINLIAVLMGRETDVNEKEIEYFTTKVAKSNRNGIVQVGEPLAGALVDHWGNGYSILLDYDGDGKVDTTGIDAVFTGFQNEEIISATPGKDKVWGGKDIKSW